MRIFKVEKRGSFGAMFNDLKNLLEERLEAATLLIITIFKLWKARPLSEIPLNSLDFSHVFKIWYIVEHGLTQWNPFWYGGFSFLNLHGPFSYSVAAAMGKLTTPVIAYNFLFNLSWILLSFAFYLFLKEYNLNKVQTSLALVIFSFFPVTLHYFRLGNLPLMFTFLLSILFWRSFKRFLEDKEGPTLSIIFYTLVLLSHPRFWFYLNITILIWFFSKHFSKQSIKKLVIVSFVSFLLSSFWLFPFIESMYLGSSGSVAVAENPVSGTVSALSSSLREMGIPLEVFILVVMTLFSGFLYSLKSKRELLREFLPFIILGSLFLLLLNYKRFSLFLLIPISILISYRHKKIGKYFLLTFFVLALSFSFFSAPAIEMPSMPQTGSRAITYPPGDSVCQRCEDYSAFLLPFQDVEIIDGRFYQVTKIGPLAERQYEYMHKINQPLEFKHEKFNQMAQEGMVNYIIINSNASEYIKYFDNNPRFKELSKSPEFRVFKASPTFSYVQINDKAVKTEFTKKGDRIEANFGCKRGNLTVKETYSKHWQVKINGIVKKFSPTEYGFIKTNLTETGSCHLEMNYNRISIYPVLLSFFGIAILLGIAFREFLNIT